ncbi:MAG: ABC transporter ATP-binding protein [Rothia sp. (in: high G+C Gram-positive bacteria)]|nr:ABC transporter ATP-binding protein [Rothia sp. (in: high G+C Gram-positive bacteria)]
MLAIETTQLTKKFKSHVAVDSLDLEVPCGQIYGFLGPNGSGKSTSMKMILGLLEPSDGAVKIFGTPLTRRNKGELIPSIGSMIEAPPGYGHLTGLENMTIIKEMLNLDSDNIHRALALVRLTKHQDKLVKNYSLGMKQRLGIAMALVKDPQLLVLDEPTNGLDPAGIEEIRNFLVDLSHQGVTIMISSHLLDEIDKIADQFGILKAGRLIFQGNREELFKESVPDLIIETPEIDRALQVWPQAVRVKNGLRIEGISRDQAAALIVQLVQASVPIYEVRRAPQSLEDVFMSITGGGDTI